MTLGGLPLVPTVERWCMVITSDRCTQRMHVFHAHLDSAGQTLEAFNNIAFCSSSCTFLILQSLRQGSLVRAKSEGNTSEQFLRDEERTFFF